MPILSDPVVSLEGVSLRKVSLSTLDLEVAIRVENNNPVGVTLMECPFRVLCKKEGNYRQIAMGNTGSAKIPAHSVTVLNVPVISHNAALTGALVSFVTGGSIEVTIEGNAVVKFLMVTKTFPFARTVPITVAQVAGIVTGQKKDR
ncbi:MAG: LEA type 2 family protein [Methanoregula sp.]|uniref:LEA type 2 family protein n=1 Tax=Methanoregula sp. TaxID=2052170 RepID=UPI003BB1C537